MAATKSDTAPTPPEAPAAPTADPDEAVRRNRLGRWGWAVTVLGAALTLFQLYTAWRGPYVALIQGPLHLGTALGIVFLLYPPRRGRAGRDGVPWYDALLALAAVVANYYVVVNYERLVTQSLVFGFTPADVAVGVLGLALVLEATRRCVGLPIVVVALVALAYGHFGPYLGPLSHPGLDWEQLVTEMFFSSSAVFGTPIQVSSTYIYLFLLFGVVLTRTGIGRFLDDLAFALTGRFTGGTAKATVVSSALQGTISGSSVANTVASGSFTIPMMKRAGFRKEFAGAAEAASSTGGQIMPPVMGAAAFIMAAYTGISYDEIILMAAIPALLYFTGVFFGTHFEARRQGIRGLSREELPPVRDVLRRADMIIPVIVMIFLLMSGRTPTLAAIWGIVTALVVGLFRADTRPSLRGLGGLLVEGAKWALPVVAACATAGIVAGIVTKTGLGSKIAGGLLDLSMGNLWLLLVLTMLACLVLGMGLPTTANYIVTATVAAPALMEFGVPAIAAHLFVFYFGVVADITPPVCLASYAAAGIARADPMKVGVVSVKLAIAAFVIPYMFVANPLLVLQDVTVPGLVTAVAASLLGMTAVSAALMGFLVTRGTRAENVVLFAAGLGLIYPGLATGIPALAALAAVLALQWRRSRRPGPASDSAATRTA